MILLHGLRRVGASSSSSPSLLLVGKRLFSRDVICRAMSTSPVNPDNDFVLSHPAEVDHNDPLDNSRGRIVCITSGKGGVGKTTSAASFALGLAQRGRKTCVVDFDVGLRNLGESQTNPFPCVFLVE